MPGAWSSSPRTNEASIRMATTAITTRTALASPRPGQPARGLGRRPLLGRALPLLLGRPRLLQPALLGPALPLPGLRGQGPCPAALGRRWGSPRGLAHAATLAGVR